MDADPAVSADLVLVALDAPRSHPPPALPCHVTRAGPPPVGPVRSTPEITVASHPLNRVNTPRPPFPQFDRSQSLCWLQAISKLEPIPLTGVIAIAF
jgi:hypothetical protein